jgi:Na+/H+ antiporter NhaD/arsenite permease-like protein
VALLYRGAWRLKSAAAAAVATPVATNHIETAKAAVVTLAVIAAFVLTDWPRSQIALAGAAVMLLNRRIASSDLLRAVDGDLILLLMGLFVVNAAFAATGVPQRLLEDLRAAGADLSDPLTLLAVISVLSNLVGNNPAVMLLAPFLEKGADADALGAAIALGTGFSSNMVIFGSLAGIIVVEQAAAKGVKIGFGEFSRAGGLVAVVSLAAAAAWIHWLAR